MGSHERRARVFHEPRIHHPGGGHGRGRRCVFLGPDPRDPEGWPLKFNLDRAREFAGAVVGLRGATTTDPAFYSRFRTTWVLHEPERRLLDDLNRFPRRPEQAHRLLHHLRVAQRPSCCAARSRMLSPKLRGADVDDLAQSPCELAPRWARKRSWTTTGSTSPCDPASAAGIPAHPLRDARRGAVAVSEYLAFKERLVRGLRPRAYANDGWMLEDRPGALRARVSQDAGGRARSVAASSS